MGGHNLIVFIHMDVQSGWAIQSVTDTVAHRVKEAIPGSIVIQGDNISWVEDAKGVRLQRICLPGVSFVLAWRISNTYHGLRVFLADQLLLNKLCFLLAGFGVGEGGLESSQRKEASKGELHSDQGLDV
jgi:hypothetical protein